MLEGIPVHMPPPCQLLVAPRQQFQVVFHRVFSVPLDEVVVDGIETTLPLFRALVREKDVIDGNYHIHWLEQFLARGGIEA